MPDAATIAVLRDMAMLIIVALVFGVAAYAYLRHRSAMASWSQQGNVCALQFDLPDAVLAAFLVFMLLSGLLLGDTATKDAFAPSSAPESSQLQSTTGQILLMVMGAAVLVFWLKLVRGFDLIGLFGLRQLTLRQVFITAAFWIVPTMILVSAAHEGVAQLLSGIWPMDEPQVIVKSFQSTNSIPTRLLMALAASVFAPVTEELMFRGVIYGVFKRYTDTWFAALITALLFATVHMHIASFVPLFILALSLIAAYEFTGCLLVPMAMHAIFNTLMLVAMLGD